MRLQNTILLLFALLLSSAATAQRVDISEAIVKKMGDTVMISFNAKVAKISTNQMLTLTPVLWNGDKEQVLQSIVLMGRNKAITQARKGIVVTGVVRINSDTTATLYKAKIPFENWMGIVSLRLDKTMEWCLNKEILPSVEIASNQLVPISSPITPVFERDVKMVYMSTFKSVIKDYPFVHVRGSQVDNLDGLIIHFAQGSSTISELHADNKNSIRKILEATRLIRLESNIELTKITINGGTSPEGSYDHNKRLGQSRAESFINYVRGDIALDVFEINNIGENWDGLYRMVEGSDMEYRDEVLSIIDNYPIFEGREKKLMDLRGGDPYRYMLKEFFPALRNASFVRVFYDLKPNDDFEQIDKASALIKQKSYSEALEILLQVTPSPYTDNLIGVCYMMGEDAANASVYLQRAIEGGDSNARKNLEQLDNIQHK